MKRNRSIICLTAALLAVVLFTGPAPAQNDSRAEALLQAARNKGLVDGDLEAAIGQYKKILATNTGNRTVTATALVEMGRCYEKLGHAGASKAYERVLREFAEQREAVTEARSRLAGLKEHSTGLPTLAVRRVWDDGDVDWLGQPSPDGRHLSFVEWGRTGDLAVRDLQSGKIRHVTDKGSWDISNEYAYNSTFSPDGKQIAFAWWSQPDRVYDLRVISFNGAPDAKPRVVYKNLDIKYLQPTDWSPDGKQVLTILKRKDATHQIALISVADGSMRVLKTVDWRWPGARLSPDGRYVVYDFPPKEDSPERDIFLLAADGSREVPMIEHSGSDYVLGWSPDGSRILFASDRAGTLGAWTIPVADGRPQGQPELVKRDVGRVLPLGFTQKGTFYYGLEGGMSEVCVARLDPATGEVLTPPAPVAQRFVGANTSPSWSADGQYLAYLSRRHVNPPGDDVRVGRRVLCIHSLRTGEERQLSVDLSFDTFRRLEWSPDGRYILTAGNDNKRRAGLFRIDVQTGEVTLLITPAEHGVWSSDGKAVFYVHRDPVERKSVIRVRQLDTNRERELYRTASSATIAPASARTNINHLAISPDSRWVAFVAQGNSTAGRELRVIPAAGGEARLLLSLPDHTVLGGQVKGVEWTRNSEHLLFSRNGRIWRIPAQGGQPEQLSVETGREFASIAAHPDGQRVAFTRGERRAEIWVMENFLPRVRAAR